MSMKLIVANWKENPENFDTVKELLSISQKFESKAGFLESYKILHAVPSVFLGLLENKENVILQNISNFTGGSHTGEVSAKQAKSLGVKMSIVGHSETRLSPENPHGDEDKDVNQKVHILISEGMETLLCIGEREREVENPDAYKPFLRSQILSCLDRIEEKDFDKIILAYEPVWAIGEKAARPATEKEIEETIDFVKLELSKNFRVKIFVLYGGSVDENNISRILSIRNVDGVLVGRASSDPKKWGLLLNSLDF